jgi:hypothetical protein
LFGLRLRLRFELELLKRGQLCPHLSVHLIDPWDGIRLVWTNVGGGRADKREVLMLIDKHALLFRE